MPVPFQINVFRTRSTQSHSQVYHRRGVDVLFTSHENYIKFELMIRLEASVSSYNMPFQYLPEGTEKEHKTCQEYKSLRKGMN